MSSITGKSSLVGLNYHPNAYQFVNEALHFTQQKLGRIPGRTVSEEDAHITGPELVEGIRELAQQQFGLMARVVFHTWGVHATDDFGRIVFDMIEQQAMRKTESDQLSDFFGLYDFEDAFDRNYHIDVSCAFQ